MPKSHLALVAAGLVAAIGLVYQGVLAHDFVDLDDYIHIVHNENLAGDLDFEAVTRAFTTSYGITANWVPLSALSLQVDHSLFGGRAASYHATNVALHALSSLGLFAALAMMTGALWRSAFVAFVFALHPVQVESVAWAAERKGLLCGLFFMATLIAYAAYARKPGPGLRYGAVVAGCAAALLSKPMAVTLPFVLLLLDYWPLRRMGAGDDSAWPTTPRLVRLLAEKLPLLALAAAASFVTLEVQRAAGATGFGSQLSVGARIANALESWVAYLGDLLWPSGLAVFYPHPYFDGLDSLWPALGAAALLATITTGLLYASRTRPYLAVGWLWFLGMGVPAIGFVTVGLAARADRYLYLPMIGVAIAVTWAAADLVSEKPARRNALAVLGGVILIALGVSSHAQLQHWRGSIALFEHAIAVTENNFLAHHRLATAKLFGGRADESEAHYRESIRSGPPRAGVHAALADLLAESGELDEAIVHYEQALALDPDNGRYRTKLGFALLLDERYEDARPELDAAAAQLGHSTEMLVGMAMAAAGSGDLVAAVGYYRAALSVKPNLLTVADKLAWILATTEDVRVLDPEEAIRLAEAVTGQRRTARTLDTLAAAYASARRFDDALRTAGEAESLARSQGDETLVAPIRERMIFYEQGRPFIDWNSRAVH